MTRAAYTRPRDALKSAKSPLQLQTLIGNGMHSPASATALKCAAYIFLIGNEFHFADVAATAKAETTGKNPTLRRNRSGWGTRNGKDSTQVDQVGEEESGGGGEAADQGGLQGAAPRGDVGVARFDEAENQEGEERDADGDRQRGENLADEHVRSERNQAADNVGPGDGGGAASSARSPRFFEAQLEAHHEIDPAFLVGADGVDDRLHVFVGETVAAKDFRDFLLLLVGDFNGLLDFAAALGGVMLGVGLGGEVAAESHGDGAGDDFGESRGDDDARGRDCSGESGGEREGDSQAVGHADDDVANRGRGSKVLLKMGDGWHVRSYWFLFRAAAIVREIAYFTPPHPAGL